MEDSNEDTSEEHHDSDVAPPQMIPALSRRMNAPPYRRQRNSGASIGDGLLALAQSHTLNAQAKINEQTAIKFTASQQAVMDAEDRFSFAPLEKLYHFIQFLTRDHDEAETYIVLNDAMKLEMFEDVVHETEPLASYLRPMDLDNMLN
jgi:hypothetical protein